MLRRDTRVYLQKLKIQGSSLKMRMSTQAKPLKMEGRRLGHYSEFK